nr:ribonuclease H-like domain-containing protein [Tanacetum cinerariifolium]
MNDETNALLRNDTWEIVDLPKDRKAIGSKRIFKIKYKSSGGIDRYKARLVTQGFNQKEGIDYEKTFSPVVKMVTARCLLNLVVSSYWHVFQLDVNNTFIYGDLNETMYMKLLERYYLAGDNKVCRLKKSLYGPDKGVFLALLVYVDDIIITGNSVSEIEKFKVFLKSKSIIKDLGKLKYFFGIEVIDTYKGLGVHIVKDTCMSLKAFSDAD